LNPGTSIIAAEENRDKTAKAIENAVVEIKEDNMHLQLKPYWFDEWVIISDDGWKLKEGAPNEIKEEFDKYMEDN